MIEKILVSKEIYTKISEFANITNYPKNKILDIILRNLTQTEVKDLIIRNIEKRTKKYNYYIKKREENGKHKHKQSGKQ